jgi:hypothetical protein
MKKMCLKISVFLITIFIIANIFSYAVLRSERLKNFFGVYRIASEVYGAINESRKGQRYDTFIIGDSVARQLMSVLDGYKRGVVDLTSNQAISMAGQYILVDNILKSNPNVKSIYLLYTPKSLDNNLNQKWTYNYFIKPFYLNNSDKFTSNTSNKVNKKIYSVFYLFPMSKVLPIFFVVNYKDQSYQPYNSKLIISETSIEYLQIIKRICAERKVVFKIIPLPISKKYQKEYSYAITQVHQNMLDDVFGAYFNNILVLSDKYFIDDAIHFKSDSIEFVAKTYLSRAGLVLN